MAWLQKINVYFLNKMCQYLLDGEPVFIMRAQDKATEAGVIRYVERTKELGGTNVERATAGLEEIREWQKGHPERLRVAD